MFKSRTYAFLYMYFQANNLRGEPAISTGNKITTYYKVIDAENNSKKGAEETSMASTFSSLFVQKRHTIKT